jgi:hypothetical protein
MREKFYYSEPSGGGSIYISPPHKTQNNSNCQSNPLNIKRILYSQPLMSIKQSIDFALFSLLCSPSGSHIINQVVLASLEERMRHTLYTSSPHKTHTNEKFQIFNYLHLPEQFMDLK